MSAETVRTSPGEIAIEAVRSVWRAKSWEGREDPRGAIGKWLRSGGSHSDLIMALVDLSATLADVVSNPIRFESSMLTGDPILLETYFTDLHAMSDVESILNAVLDVERDDA